MMRMLGVVLLMLLIAPVGAQPDVERLLAQAEAPVGVVFEVVEGEEDALRQAFPQIMQLARRLRDRFPGLPIAVVTHGREQFGLLVSEAAGPLAGVHAQARDLVGSDVDLHVCGVHAGWYGHGPEDFPSYVDVAASGPAQINDYENLGYEVVRLQLEED